MNVRTETSRMHEITINDEQRLALMSILNYWLHGGNADPDDDVDDDFVVRLNTLLQKAATETGTK